MDLELGLPFFSFGLETHIILVVVVPVTNIMFCHDTNLKNVKIYSFEK